MFPKSFEITYLPSYIVCAVGIVANMMLLIAFIKDPLKCFRNSATYLVGNLALSDLMYCVAVIASVHGNPNVNYFFRNFAFYVSVWTIFSIAVDRHTMISYPLKHRLLMRRKRITMWIAFIWIVSSVHPILGAVQPEKKSNILKPGTGVVLIALTGILYGKTYFSLKKQARLMAGKKITFSGKLGDDKKNECGDKHDKMCINRARRADDGNKRVVIEIERGEHRKKHVENHIERNDDRVKRVENQTERVEGKNKRLQNHIERDDDQIKPYENQIGQVEDENKCVENRIERDDGRMKRDENHIECVGGENKRVENHTKRDDGRMKRDENQIEHVEDENKRVENHIERDDGRMKHDENQIERVEGENKRVENHDKRDNDQNRRVECHIKRVEEECGTQTSNDNFNIIVRSCTSPQITSVSCSISSQNYCIKASNNANEQKFLNTIIIIAVITAVTVFPATMYGSLTKTVFQSNEILHSLFTTIVSLNFAANPFVYYLRLKRYRKTFKILYGCKAS